MSQHSVRWRAAAVSSRPVNGSLYPTCSKCAASPEIELGTEESWEGTWQAETGESTHGPDGVSGAVYLEKGTQSLRFEENRYRLRDGLFRRELHPKDLIVLHFTAGRSCESAWKTWSTDPKRIATAFGVDPDGLICQFFPPEYWAHHLGVPGTWVHDRRSIGIEIANVGPLKINPASLGELVWWSRNWGSKYCGLEETNRYVQRSYRGIDYFATMPGEQQAAVGTLVRHLCERFSIPRVATAEARAGEFSPERFSAYCGVASHSNFRADKWDVGPAFDWEQLGF